MNPKEVIQKATVKILDDDNGKIEGQGIIISNGHVITVAHLLNPCRVRDTYRAPEESFYSIRIKDCNNEECSIKPIFTEFGRDIAVLGEPNSQCIPTENDPQKGWIDYPQKSKEYKEFETVVINGTKAPIYRGRLLKKGTKVLCFTNTEEWIEGEICKKDKSTLYNEFEKSPEHGSSGGPIITLSGKLLGVFSAGGGDPI